MGKLEWFGAEDAEKRLPGVLFPEGKSQTHGRRTAGLKAAGVHHIQLRVETVQLLIAEACKQRESFYVRCVQIGRTAAADLWKCLKAGSETIFLPRDYDALVAAWNLWDERGNWGTISLKPPVTPAPPVGIPVVRHVEVANNFLRLNRTSEQLLTLLDEHDFWCGYIDGFLMEVVAHLVEPVYVTSVSTKDGRVTLDGDSFGQARSLIAGFYRVNHVCVDDTPRKEHDPDLYRVVFAPDPLLPLWDLAGQAYVHRRLKHFDKAVAICNRAVHLAKRSEGAANLYDKAAMGLSELERKRFRRLEEAETDDSEADAKEAYRTLTAFIRNLRVPDEPSDD